MQCTTGCRGRREAIGRELRPAENHEMKSNLDRLKDIVCLQKYNWRVMYDDTSDGCMVHSSKAVTPSMRCKRLLVATHLT